MLLYLCMNNGVIIYSLHHRNHTYIDNNGNGKIGNEKSE